MDLKQLASTVAFQMEQIAILQDELKKKEEIQDDLVKRLESMSVYHEDLHQTPKSKNGSKGMIKSTQSNSGPKTSPLKNRPGSQSSKPKGQTSAKKNKTPEKPKKPKSTSSKPVSTPATPSPKKNKNQMIMKETPEGFKTTKVMWGMVEAGAVPPPPSVDNIREFTSAFSSSDEIQHVMNSSAARKLVPQHEVLTLTGIKSGRRKMGRHIINIKEFFISITQSSLAKLGIRAWGPNLLEPIDSLWNEACRMSALMIFRRVAIGGAFDYMNINRTYVQNFGLLEGAYNHYVHYVMSAKYKKEAKEEGKNVKDEEKKLRDARVKFATNQGFKQRYLDLISPIDAHSDDKYSEKHNCHIVKTLEYRSNNANAFFVRLTQEMEKNNRLEGKRPQGRIRRRPKIAVMSTIGRPPKNMPIDFYNPSWFNELTDAQKTKVADAYCVALLPNAKLSFCAVSGADEKLGDKAFNAKFWDQITGFYNLSHVIGSEEDNEDDEDDDNEDSDYDDDIDLEDTSGEDDDDEQDNNKDDDGFVAADDGVDGKFDDDEFDDGAGDKHDEDGDAQMWEEEDAAREARQDEDNYWNQWQ
ncbi:uncharacterized protein MELLADRAFT_78491 [Melampsora larici-populina 98AG31]|uniref:Uncharacterized protein n=1 Tax=Melampsora larici-populina (strain 98AG31 / pathotype 3-4-7) TaxID=747676 RepID=F4RV01_MELLP|nr:uncharacterized protein MELLADRAFT_78491 [Melampsora larici-populina 98AG31]EGG03786.1 hypothetical protein MELLADRAFT_78491 [Melampsora larici-populina 98AG31]